MIQARDIHPTETHERMPLILEQDEILPWIFDNGKTEAFLHKKPCLLNRRTEFEQMSLF